MSAAGGARRGLPALALAAAVLLSLAQQGAWTDDVFFSGDGGIKSLLSRQWARGVWHPDLRLPAEPWVRALWVEDDLYPFGPPFAYRDGERWWIQYPVPFPVLAAPFYAAFGPRGLLVPPLIGLWLLFGAAAWAGHRVGLTPEARAVGLAGLGLASFATPYGALFWEHSLALGLSTLGAAALLPMRRGEAAPGRAGLAGAAMGLAVWARPEALVAAALAGAVLLWERTRPVHWGAFAAGVGGAGALLAALNLGLTGQLLGVHGVQEVDPGTLHLPHMPWWRILSRLGVEALALCPAIGACALVGGLAPRASGLRADRVEALLWATLVLLCLGTSALVPNTGGKQIGPRYLLGALPLGFAIVARHWERAGTAPRSVGIAWRAGLLALLAFGIHQNGFLQTRQIHADYAGRIRPALEALRGDPSPVVAVGHQWMAQELAALFEAKRFFRVKDDEALGRLAAGLEARGIDRFVLLRYERPRPRRLETRGGSWRLLPRGRFGSLEWVDARRLPPDRVSRERAGEGRQRGGP